MARRSGNTIEVSAPERPVVAGGVAAGSSDGADFGAEAGAGSEAWVATVSDAATSSLPPAVKRSVSVTDFLSFPHGV
jgi:hypothetical protein